MLNLTDLNLVALKEIAKEVEIKGFSTMKKSALAEAITEKMEDNDLVADTVETRLAELEEEFTPKTVAQPSLGITELTFNGKTQSIKAWADEIGIARPALYDRINRHGWSVEEALTIPKGGRRKTVKAEVEGQTSIDEASAEEDDE